MKKLYIFGDSFSMMSEHILDTFNNIIENNSHYSISNTHILKLAKIKLLKLIKNNESSNIIIQLTVSNRMLVNYSDVFPELISDLSVVSYNKKILFNADNELFEPNRYISLYPFTGSFTDPLIKNLYIPYIKYTVENNYLNLLKDLILELSILKQLALSNNINLEYFFYTNDYDKLLLDNLGTLNSEHIKFDGFNSMESYLRHHNKKYFVSITDKHFNVEGKEWYLKYLMDRYDI